jgi:hypothetical protein
MLFLHMSTQKFEKVARCDKVSVKMSVRNYVSYLKPVAFAKDFFYRVLDQKFKTLP